MNLSALLNHETIFWLPEILVLQVTVITVLGLLAGRLYRGDAATRHALYLMALLVLVVLPPVTFVCRHANWKFLRVSLPSAVAPPHTLEPQWETVSSYSREGDRWETPADSTVTPGSTASATTVRLLTAPSDLREPNPAVSAALNYFLQVWALGLLIFGMRLAGGLVAIRRLRGSSVPCQATVAELFVEKVQPHFKDIAPPQILVHDSISTAMATGIFRPAIILPRAYLETLSPDDLTAILTHEMAHIARRDPLVGLLQRIVSAVYWPHPLVHLLNVKLSRSREEICDNFVLQDETSTGYAELLFRLVKNPPTGRTYADLAPGWTISFLDPRWKLEDRVRTILDTARWRSVRFKRSVFAFAGIVCLAVVIMLAGIRTQTAAELAPLAVASVSPDEYDAMCALDDMGVIRLPDRKMMRLYETLSKRPRRSEGLWNVLEQAWPLIGRLKSVEELSIAASHFPASAWTNIARLTRLRRLDMWNPQSISGDAFQLKNLTSLEHLRLDFYHFFRNPFAGRQPLDHLTDDEAAWGKQYRERHKNHSENTINAAIFSDRLLEQLVPLKNLRSIEFSNGSITPRGVRALAAFPQLTSLTVGFLDFGLSEARILGKMSSLRRLRQIEVDDAMLAEICHLQGLEYLDAWSSGVTDASVDQLLKLTRMRRLEIRGNQLTDDGLLRLAELKSLQRLDVQFGKRITPEGVREFRKIRPDCQVRFVAADGEDPAARDRRR